MTVDASPPRLGRVRPLSKAGRIRHLGRSDAEHSPATSGAIVENRDASRQTAILAVSLPLFCQVFHYMIDVPPLYYASKALPVLALPLAVKGLTGVRSPHRLTYLLALTYVMVVTPILSILWLGNGMFDALANTVKVWPLIYYFAVLALLIDLAPSPATLQKVVFWLGLGTMLLMWFLWGVIPRRFYASDPAISRLLLYEFERGYRIYFPLTFVVLAMFDTTNRLLRRPSLWHALFLIAGFATIFLIFKQRTIEAATLLVTFGIVFAHLPRLWRSLGLLLLFLAGIAIAVVAVWNLDKITGMFGGSLAVRRVSMGLLTHYLLSDPLRWVLGVGGTSRFGAVSLFDILGRRNFYLADLGWAGVLFEYGVVGSLLLLALYLAPVRRRRPTESAKDGPPSNSDGQAQALEGALWAYGAFLLLSTAVYSAVYAPGELATITALLVYIRGEWSTKPT
jgi:hypothetical protein